MITKIKKSVKITLSIACVGLLAIGCKKQEMPPPISPLGNKISNTISATTPETKRVEILASWLDFRFLRSAQIFDVSTNNRSEVFIYPYLSSCECPYNYLLTDTHGKSFGYNPSLHCVKDNIHQKIPTGLKGPIKILRSDDALVYEDQSSPPIFKISGTRKAFVFSAQLEIREYDGRIVIDNCLYSGAALNHNWGSNPDHYLIADKNGRKYRFTTQTTMPFRKITDLCGNKIRVFENKLVIFDNIAPSSDPIFIIKGFHYVHSHRKQETKFQIKRNVNGEIIIDNRTEYDSFIVKEEYLITAENGEKYLLVLDSAAALDPTLSMIIETGLTGKIRVHDNIKGRYIYSEF